MTPAARAQAAIELLDQIIAAARDAGAAADTLIARYFKERRYAGSKDRRAIRELVYAAIRRSGDRPPSGRAALVGLALEDQEVAALFDGSIRGPHPIDPGEPAAPARVVPSWLADRLATSIDPDEFAALLDRAPLDLRANRLKIERSELAPLLPGALFTPHSPDGLRFEEPIAIEALPAFEQGLFEVQDEGSQLVSIACGAAAGMTVVDLCAGAGGKTLAIAAAMAGRGRIVACDADRSRLSRLAPRAERAGAGAMVETRLLDSGREALALASLEAQADLVLVDAPCSGTGTWRRNPEARWRLTPDRLGRLVGLQARLLDVAARLVKPGGHLIHIVCSLLPEEGAGQVSAFLARNRGWTPADLGIEAGRERGDGRLLSPAYDRTDGFFVARLQKPW